MDTYHMVKLSPEERVQALNVEQLHFCLVELWDLQRYVLHDGVVVFEKPVERHYGFDIC